MVRETKISPVKKKLRPGMSNVPQHTAHHVEIETVESVITAQILSTLQ